MIAGAGIDREVGLAGEVLRSLSAQIGGKF